MTVIQTDKWLEKSYDKPEKIFQKLAEMFNLEDYREIASILIKNGMYQKPEKNGENLINTLKNKNVWQIIKKEEQYLQKEWSGKNVPIFIFPSNSYNWKIKEHYKGRTGLAFHDKLFLFISDETTEEELKALFTHEYNHICRLYQDPKKERNYSLLDVVILEGIAENAVLERFGAKPLAPWTSYYSESELKEIWNDLIFPNKDLSKTSRKSTNLLYGNSFYPEMAGYCVGYYLVKQYVKKTGIRTKDLIKIPAEKIVI
ncbi:DUF2268 domain-containing protein [Ornithinibacillus sp. 179-J 7C1 HS]|uniref:DUF2268 domain-containing protein n=1 Tax=Ornithinibacillus sp. 179-J 7C1 HS TaxID=3142384 RepID=UPI0039A13145